MYKVSLTGVLLSFLFQVVHRLTGLGFPLLVIRLLFSELREHLIDSLDDGSDTIISHHLGADLTHAPGDGGGPGLGGGRFAARQVGGLLDGVEDLKITKVSE
jgi:hypothetical protein